jgi:hypothetical protein
MDYLTRPKARELGPCYFKNLHFLDKNQIQGTLLFLSSDNHKFNILFTKV